jgi:hypothetical protein
LLFPWRQGRFGLLVLLLMVEYIETALSCCSSLVLDDLDEVVLIEAVSDETLEVLLKREKGSEGIVVGYRL